MRRRALLATLGASVAGLAGCQFQQRDGTATEHSSSLGQATEKRETEQSTPQPTETEAQTPIEPVEPGPADESRFEGVSVPSMAGNWYVDAEPTWYHNADESTPSYVRPETETVTLPAEVTFTFHNHTRRRLECGHWYLYKLHDWEWFYIGPRYHTGNCVFVDSGEIAEWEPTLVHTRTSQFAPSVIERRAFGYLGGGRYGVVAAWGHETGYTGSLIGIDAEPMRVVPEENLTVERGGSKLIATSPRHADAERTGTVVVGRTDSADERLIAEQIMQGYGLGLRNTIGFFESDTVTDISTVELRTSRRVAREAGSEDALRTVTYGDEQYYVRVEAEG